jgi:hypothetical protein
LVSTSPLAPPQGFRSLRPQRLSTRRQVHQRHSTTTTTLRGTTASAEYSPSTTLASGNAASAAGASGSA